MKQQTTSPTVGVFFGGKSPEHDVSILTGELIISGLRDLGYPVVPVYIGKGGVWHTGDGLGDVSFFKKGAPGLSRLSSWYLDLQESTGKEKMVLKKKGLSGKTLSIDIAFPAFHGQNGEDGTMQGLFEMIGVPYVGCGVAASAITMDKVLTKLFYERHGLPTTSFVYFLENEWKEKKDSIVAEVLGKLTFPFFVKPARLGSSIGIGKVNNEADLRRAVEVALRYDEKVIIEQGIENVMDVTCAVLEERDGTLSTSLLQESLFAAGFFSYEDKYLTDGGAQLGNAEGNLVIPARLDEETTQELQTIAKKVFSLFECSGIARVDFLYDKSANKAYVNEINTLPGTLYHHLFKKSGRELSEVLEVLLVNALTRAERTERHTVIFESDILKHADWSAKLGGKKERAIEK